MQELTTQSEIDELLGAPRALLLKHGATCPISAKARDEVAKLCERLPDLKVGALEVTSNRALADALADRLGIEHQSPQVFLMRDGEVAWRAEHYEIKADAVERQLGD